MTIAFLVLGYLLLGYLIGSSLFYIAVTAALGRASTSRDFDDDPDGVLIRGMMIFFWPPALVIAAIFFLSWLVLLVFRRIFDRVEWIFERVAQWAESFIKRARLV